MSPIFGYLRGIRNPDANGEFEEMLLQTRSVKQGVS
jgi:hypothetical protein